MGQKRCLNLQIYITGLPRTGAIPPISALVRGSRNNIFALVAISHNKAKPQTGVFTSRKYKAIHLGCSKDQAKGAICLECFKVVLIV